MPLLFEKHMYSFSTSLLSTIVHVCMCVLNVCTVPSILQDRYKTTTNPERQRNKHNP